MRFPTFSQLRAAVLFFCVFFSLVGVVQYFFVSEQATTLIKKQLRTVGKQANDVIAYNAGIDLKQYNKASIQAPQYFVVLNDGSIIDFVVTDTGVPPGLIPPVECPVCSDSIFAAPTKTTFMSGAKQAETWTLIGRRLERGIVVVGISEYAHVAKPNELLIANLSLFGITLDTARKVSPSKPDNEVSWAVIDDHNMLVTGGGRIPLRTDAIAIGKALSEPAYNKETGYFVLYSPITDKSATDSSKGAVGVIVLPMEMPFLATALSSLQFFTTVVAAISIVTFFVLTLFYNRKHERDKREIREKFQNHFSPQVLELIEKEPERLEGQRREMVILFSDIRSFTNHTAKLAPQKLTQLLQSYFNEMTETVFSTDGVLDKCIGDAIMAFWGAPIEQKDSANRAVNTALEMMKRLQKLHIKWSNEDLPAIDIGIGIDLGVANVGKLGSAKRYDYTVIGDVVNVASRLESLNKELKTHILISEAVKMQLTIPVKTRDLGNRSIRGRDASIHVFEVLVENTTST